MIIPGFIGERMVKWLKRILAQEDSRNQIAIITARLIGFFLLMLMLNLQILMVPNSCEELKFFSQSLIVDNAINTDTALESMIDKPESLVKEVSAIEDAQTLELMESPTRRDGDNVGAYQILGISSLVLSLLAATVLYVKRRSDETLHPVAISSTKFLTHHVVKEKHSSQNWPTEVDVAGESCPSEMSSFQISSSYSKKYPKAENNEAQSMEKKPRKVYMRESLATSESSMGSPSYGSFTTYERILPSRQVKEKSSSPL
ncbi:putative protein isoform X1 [Capsicum chacoense]